MVAMYSKMRLYNERDWGMNNARPSRNERRKIGKENGDVEEEQQGSD